jgi:DNA-binding response OmpR family regulator
MLKLTEYEFGVGWLLFNNPGKALSREYMMENVWRLPNTVNSRCVDTCVSALRKKIKSTGCDQIEITGVYGTGYRLDIHESSMGGVGGQPHSEIRDRADDYQWTGC